MIAAKDSADVGAAGGKKAIKARRDRIEAIAIAPHDVVCDFNEPALAVLEQNGNGAARPAPKPPKARLVRVADVETRRVDWLWQGRVPFGMVTLLDGDPGLGKSTLVLDLVARVTRGDVMPDGGPWLNGGPSNAIVLMLEDAIEYTIRPRLEAAGADLERVFVMTGVRNGNDDPDSERPPILPVDVGALRDAMLEHAARLIIIDPLMAYLGTDTDSHKDQDIRRALTPLATLAAETGAAIVIVRHLRKSAGPALYRGGGSIGIMGSARMGLFLARDPADNDARILAVSKSNIAKDTIPALRWRLVDTASGVARAQWEGIAEGVTADQLANHEPDHGKNGDEAKGEVDKVDQVADALRRMLTDGPVSARLVEKEVMAELGCSQRTVRRACSSVRVVKTQTKSDKGRVSGWEWSLPPTPGGHVDTDS